PAKPDSALQSYDTPCQPYACSAMATCARSADQPSRASHFFVYGAPNSQVWSMTMMNLTNAMTALALGLALTVAASPASAKNRAQHAGYAARAQAVGTDVGGVRDPRAKALRECSTKAEPLRDYTWGNNQYDLYRACM